MAKPWGRGLERKANASQSRFFVETEQDVSRVGLAECCAAHCRCVGVLYCLVFSCVVLRCAIVLSSASRPKSLCWFRVLFALLGWIAGLCLQNGKRNQGRMGEWRQGREKGDKDRRRKEAREKPRRKKQKKDERKLARVLPCFL